MQKVVTILCFLFFSALVFSQGSKRMVTNYTGNIKELKGANSSEGDFSLVMNQGKAFFASSRETSIIHYGENNWTKSSKIGMFQADLEKIDDFYEMNLTNVSALSEIKDEFTHVGPVCFSDSGDTLFFTKVPNKQLDKALKTYRPQLYMLTKTNGKWAKTPQVLPFNNPTYSFAHPSYHSASSTLYFVSDMKGGQGGKDIYSAELKNGKWTKPSNIKYINSKQDEVFPFIGADKTLFFSSNRPEALGGLDVFYSEGKRSTVQKLDFVNSEADDFGVFMVADKNIGFVSSNRNGNDDLFAFTVNKERDLKNSLFGKFKYRQLAEAIETPMAVFLLNEKMEPIAETYVDENGEFEFFDISLTEGYTVRAKSKAEMDLVIFDGEGKPDGKLLANEEDEFVYAIVDIKDVGSLNLTQVNDAGETVIEGRFLFEEEPWEEPGVLTVNLIDEKGKVAYTVESDSKGFFDFKGLPDTKDYIVKLEEENTELTLIIFNQDGKVVEKLKDDGTGFYLYRQLKVLEVNNLKEKNYLREELFSFDSGLISGDFDKNGKDIEFSEALKVSVYDDKGTLVETIVANKKGVFEYTKLPGIDNYDFNLDQMPEDFDLSGITLKIVDEAGIVIKELQPESNGSFQYKSLEILNIQALGKMNSVDEGDFSILADAIVQQIEGQIKYNDSLLNRSEGVEVSVFDSQNNLKEKLRTNSSGEFSFSNADGLDDFKFRISEKPESMKMELFSIDIVGGNGFKSATLLPLPSGDFKYKKIALPSLDNPLSAMNEIEESIDLIFEIKGNYDYDNKEGNFNEKLRVFAYDGNGQKIGEAVTDHLGNFVFRQLPGISTVLFKLESMPEGFDLEDFSLFIEGENGKQLAKLRSSEKGFFVYKPLGFASDLPFDLTEQLEDDAEHAIFGTNALDLTNKIESVYFGSNKTNPNSSDVLKVEKMLLLLEINPKSQLEINAYADSRASDNYNLILSERRADWIKNYLVRKGIDSGRLVINAYGEGKLVNDCQDGVDCPDKEHALNRRAELRIIN